MTDTSELPPLFLYQCRHTVNIMRRAGLSSAKIACIIQDIRSVTLNEEFNRLRVALERNPPHHHTWQAILQAIDADKESRNG